MNLSVFVCGTYFDLSAERGAILDALQRLQITCASMELFGARSQRPIETCLAEVRRSTLLVAVVGGRYGTLVPDLGISYSEAEYNEAFRLSIPCLIYFLVTSSECEEPDPQKAVLLESWKRTLKERHTCAKVDTASLAVQVAVDIPREMRRMEQEATPAPLLLAETSGAPFETIDERRLEFKPISSQRFGDECRQLLNGLAIDPEGNIVTCGDFWGSLDFGPSRLTSAGDRSIFLAKFSPAGKCLWSQSYGDKSEQVGVGVDTDSNGAIFVTSAFCGSLNFGGTALVSRGRYNVALAKLNGRGSHVWSQCFGDDKYHVPESIAVSPARSVVVAGRFQGSINFGCGIIRSESAQTDIFVADFSADGACRWARRFGGPHEQQTRSIAIDSDGNIGLTGVFKSEISFGGFRLAVDRPGEYCGFLTKFDESGRALWCKRFGEPPVEQGSVVTFDRTNGDILAAGFMRNKLPNGASPICLFARYDPHGILQWSKAFGTNAIATSISTSADGRILLTGYFDGTIDVGVGPAKSAGGFDVFAALFGPDGRALWMKSYGDERHQFLIKGGLGPDGRIALAGSFHGTIDFGTGALRASGYDGASEGTEDVFLAVLRHTDANVARCDK